MQYEIKTPDEHTNLNDVYPYNWDFMLYDKPYNVVSISEYYHSPSNNLYCYPSKEKISHQNLIPFNKDWQAVNWSFEFNQLKSTKVKWDSIRTNCSWEGIIYRNGKPFHTVLGRDRSYVMAKVETDLALIESHAISFHFRNWSKEAINRKIWYDSTPCIIKRVEGTSFYIEAETGVIEAPPTWKRHKSGMVSEAHWNEEYADGLNVSFDDPRVDWFRD